MSSLTVRNNWEKYEWKFEDKSIDPRDVEEVIDVNGIVYPCRTKEVYNTVYDHGKTYQETTTDLLVEARLVGGIEVELSLYTTPQIRNAIIDVVLKG